MAAGHVGLWAAVVIDAIHVDGADGDGAALVGDVVDPGEGRRRGPELRHVLVRHHHDVPALEPVGEGQAGVGRVRKGGAGVDAGDVLRSGHVLDVEDEEAVVPVADVKPVAEAERVVAAGRHPVIPGVLFAARLPLAGDPPAADLLRPRRVGEIEDHHDVADVALGRRRDVGVAAVEGEAVHALAGGAPLGDEVRLGGVRNVVDAEPAAEAVGVVAAAAEALVIDQHDAVRGADLVRVPALRQLDARQRARVRRVGHVDDGGARRPAHVADVERGAVDPDLPAARAVDMGEPAGAVCVGHAGAAPPARSGPPARGGRRRAGRPACPAGL